MPLETLQRRLNAHTDNAGQTMVFQDSVGGLEVHDGHGFTPVVPRRGTVVLNVGDMLERQTNGRWKSAVHRVAAPPEGMLRQGSSVVDRYSVVYFGWPDPDVVIGTLPGCEQVEAKHGQVRDGALYLVQVAPQEDRGSVFRGRGGRSGRLRE
ncbi:hypothetical protein HIM_06379 [Hirsutella minnesotensis 3608]|uniref:Fe2OG dioxygenase domain-containing protein n=1 Tax=Hirsutella minnesotensis 3608 TaxID=1043627 RepID=A0A0F7ZU30_9HYPO|nr:hypothetical protein HIM_06379 [Hirsutella minnesotensis 3608]